MGMRLLLAKSAYVESLRMSISPPLGPLAIASYTKLRRPGDEIRFIDLRFQPQEQFDRLVSEWRPDVVGISALTIECQHAARLAARSKALRPESKVVLGGPHPTAYVERAAQDPNVDVTVLHEGEETFVELLGALERGEDLSGVKGIAFRGPGGRVVRTPERPYIDDLDVLPPPAWELIDFKDYEGFRSFAGPLAPRRVAPIMTSRACPYRCTYCHDMFGKKFQTRSPKHVLDEMEYLYRERGVRHFEIVDDIFNMDRKRAAAILQGIIDRGMKPRLAFPNGLRGDLLDEPFIDLFARAGTEYVSLAVETASPRLQKMIRKHMRLDRLRASIDAFVERRVFVNCFYMLGFPTETVEEMESTIAYACAAPSHTAMFFIVTPFEGTEMSRTMDADVPEPYEGMGYCTGDINVTGTIPTKTLHRAAKLAHLRVVSDPRRLYRVFRDHPNRSQILGMGLSLLARLTFDNLHDNSWLARAFSALERWTPAPLLRLAGQPTSMARGELTAQDLTKPAAPAAPVVAGRAG
jgi:anaerobic magnesium-protoporphyrin IX monomethyl ester cyclase